MECERPSGFALTGNDDHFEWIELIARSPSGGIVARAFVQIGDHQAIDTWPERSNNTGVLLSHSICIYAEPNRDARYVVPFYLHARSESDLDGARRCLVEAGEQILIQMEAPSACVHWYFDGHNGFQLFIAFRVFDPFYSPWIFDLYADIAAQQDRFQSGFLDLSIYSQDYMWTFPNSRGSSGLYKIPLTEDEISELPVDEILALAASPRPEDSYLDAYVGKYAPWWFTSELKRIEQKRTRCLKCSESTAQPTHGRAILPCVQAIESAVLVDGTRHATYIALARYWAHLNLHYPEIVARLRMIDNRNPIRDAGDIEKAAEHGCRHPGVSLCDSPLRQYCPQNGCEIGELKRHVTE